MQTYRFFEDINDARQWLRSHGLEVQDTKGWTNGDNLCGLIDFKCNQWHAVIFTSKFA